MRLAGLCKGSTADSDSVCEGSNPSPAAKKQFVYGRAAFVLPVVWQGIRANAALIEHRRYCRLVNDALQRRKRKKDIERRLPVERTHGEIIILPLTDGKLFYKIVKRIETMRSIEFLVVFSMTAFYLAVMSGCEWSDLLMPDTKLFKRFLEERRQLLPAVPHLVCKLKSVICLNAFYGIWELLHYVFQENSRGKSTVVLFLTIRTGRKVPHGQKSPVDFSARAYPPSILKAFKILLRPKALIHQAFLWRFIQFEAGLFSLRLGHGTALTCPRHVIHSRAAASLPSSSPAALFIYFEA